MKNETKYHIFLLVVFIAVWIWGAIHPHYRSSWLLENYLVFIFVPIIILTSIYFRLSKTSYTLLTAYMILHVIGAHYSYAEVPFGYFIQNLFHANRNMFDRLVHLSFGLVFTVPIREVFQRLAKVKGVWGYFIPINIILSLSAIYEIIEWLTTANINSSAGIEFLGAQGDIWDAQKDMLVAGIGSFVTTLIIALKKMTYDHDFWKEMKDSLKRPLSRRDLKEIA